MTSLRGCVRSMVATVVMLAAVSAASPARLSIAARAAAADPLGCADQVFDPSGITGDDLATAASTTAASLGADLHVRVEGSLDGDIDGRERRLETECEGWVGTDGLRADDLLVVMVSPTERQTSIYYGADYSSELTSADPQIQEYVMNPLFKEGDYETGLVRGLQAIVRAVRGGGVPEAADPIYDGSDFTVASSPRSSNSSSDGSSGGSEGLPGGLIVLVVLVLIVVVISSLAKSDGWDSSGSSGSSGSSRSWSSSSSRSRSFSSSRRSSSGSSRRSSGSSRRSGGGGSSSKW